MSKSSPKAPAAPDPEKTAAAQTATNKETAIANAQLNNVNQVTPYGNLTYTKSGGPQYNMDAYNQALASWQNSQNYAPAAPIEQVGNGSYKYKAANNVQPDTVTASAMPQLKDFMMDDGSVPQYTATTTLSPEQQKLLDLQNQGNIGTYQLGLDQLGRIKDSVSTPFSYAGLPSYGEADQNAAAMKGQEAILSRLDPQFARDEEALRSRLINQGIGQNSEAYNREMERFSQTKNDARQQAVLGGQQYGNSELASALQRRNQGIQEYTTQRNAPLNEYSALTSGQQIQNPQFQSYNNGNMQPVDYAGLVNNQYNAQLGQYNSQVAGNNAKTGALFGLGGQLGGAFLGSPMAAGIFSDVSDVRLKHNIEAVGEERGHKLYKFSYLGSDDRYVGVMAQDVEQYAPEAVHDVNGYKAVNYRMLGLEMRSA